jgi:hypothetical protein
MNSTQASSADRNQGCSSVFRSMDREGQSKRRFTQDEIGEPIETASRLDQLSIDEALTYDEPRRAPSNWVSPR